MFFFPQGRPTRSAGLLVPIAAGLVLMLAGCGDNTIHNYAAPKAPAYAGSNFPSAAAPAAAAPGRAKRTIAWKAPDAWTESPSSSNILFAVYTASSEAGDVRITVTKLRGDGGGTLSNINRWRGQVGLGPVASLDQQPMSDLSVGDRKLSLLDLDSQGNDAAQIQRMLAVIIPRPEENQTWYFKMTGPSATVDTFKDSFADFVRSVRFGDQPEDMQTSSDSSDDGKGAGDE